jgi:quercetin dioxygenase-like cupin family protein
MDAKTFESQLRSQGFDEILTKELPAGMNNELHTHDFDVRALVVSGEIALIRDGVKQAYRPGEEFTMDAGCPHQESVGPAGVRYVVGRRHQPAK